MFRKQHPVAGSRPGTLKVPADSPPTRIRVLTYSQAEVVEKTISDLNQIDDHVADGMLLWIDVQGFRDVELLAALAERFEVHPLALEAVVNVPHRPNVESYHNQLVVIGRLLESDDSGVLTLSQVGMVLGVDFCNHISRATLRSASSGAPSPGTSDFTTTVSWRRLSGLRDHRHRC